MEYNLYRIVQFYAIGSGGAAVDNCNFNKAFAVGYRNQITNLAMTIRRNNAFNSLTSNFQCGLVRSGTFLTRKLVEQLPKTSITTILAVYPP